MTEEFDPNDIETYGYRPSAHEYGDTVFEKALQAYCRSSEPTWPDDDPDDKDEFRTTRRNLLGWAFTAIEEAGLTVVSNRWTLFDSFELDELEDHLALNLGYLAMDANVDPTSFLITRQLLVEVKAELKSRVIPDDGPEVAA